MSFLHKVRGVPLWTLLFLSLVPRSAQAAFGVSPPWVKHPGVLPGSTFVQQLSFSTSTPNDGAAFEWRLDTTCDAELATWLQLKDSLGTSLSPNTPVPWPSGETWMKIDATVTVPASAADGTRTCGIFTKRCAPPSIDGGVAICLGAHILVEVTVDHTASVDFRTMAARIGPDFAGIGHFGVDQPITFELEISNFGAVPVTDIKVDALVYDSKLPYDYGGPTYQATMTISAKVNVPAYQSSPRVKEVISFPFTGLALGDHRVHIRTYNQDGLDYENRAYFRIIDCPDCELPDGTSGVCGANAALDGTACATGQCLGGTCVPAPDASVDSSVDSGPPADSSVDFSVDSGPSPDTSVDSGLSPDTSVDSGLSPDTSVDSGLSPDTSVDAGPPPDLGPVDATVDGVAFELDMTIDGNLPEPDVTVDSNLPEPDATTDGDLPEEPDATGGISTPQDSSSPENGPVGSDGKAPTIDGAAAGNDDQTGGGGCEVTGASAGTCWVLIMLLALGLAARRDSSSM